MASRLGDIVVLGDRDTVFGNLETGMERLPKDFRTHGSLHEMDVPIIIHNAPGAPHVDYFQHNLDLARPSPQLPASTGGCAGANKKMVNTVGAK
jgi:phosphonoacetate hydrolase